MEGFLKQEELDNIKELFEKFNNKGLSTIEEDYLTDKNLKIENNGSAIELKNLHTEQVFVSLPYFTVESETSEWWKEKWDIVDENFNKLLIKEYV